MNVVYVASLVFCIANDLPVTYFCYSIIGAGIIQLIAHIIAYFKLDFSFSHVTKETWKIFEPIFINVFLSIICVGMTSEVALIADTWFASYLPEGSITLIKYATRFMGIPLGMFASAVSTITLPYFSRVSTYAPKRLSLFIIEATKLVFWVTVPMALIMGFFSEKIFHTIFLSSKFSMSQVLEARTLLIAYLFGLFSLSLNKILLNVYYSRKVLWLPALISMCGVGVNVMFNMILVRYYKAMGLALATSISAIVQTIMLVVFLYVWFGYTIYIKNFVRFMGRYCLQLACVLPVAYIIYRGISSLLCVLPTKLSQFFIYGLGFWLWVGPLCLAVAAVVYFTRKQFGIKIYFFD